MIKRGNRISRLEKLVEEHQVSKDVMWDCPDHEVRDRQVGFLEFSVAVALLGGQLRLILALCYGPPALYTFPALYAFPASTYLMPLNPYPILYMYPCSSHLA